MDKNLLFGLGKRTIPIPPFIWQNQVKGGNPLEFMDEDHHRVRNFVVTELPRVGESLAPEHIAKSLNMPMEMVVEILGNLEHHMTFLFRDQQGSVQWAYPVTVDNTPHKITFSTGESINAA